MENQSNIKNQIFKPIYCSCCKKQICQVIESKNNVKHKIIINPTPNNILK